jgi:glutaminyl-tRNA synthetase
VSAGHAHPTEIRNYNHLFTQANPDEAENYQSVINPHSLETVANALVESSVTHATPGQSFQFIRQGYYCVDKDSTPDHLIFTLTVSLKDSWAKIEKQGNANA